MNFGEKTIKKKEKETSRKRVCPLGTKKHTLGRKIVFRPDKRYGTTHGGKGAVPRFLSRKTGICIPYGPIHWPVAGSTRELRDLTRLVRGPVPVRSTTGGSDVPSPVSKNRVQFDLVQHDSFVQGLEYQAVLFLLFYR